MNDISAQHILIEFIRRLAPGTLAEEMEALHTHHAKLLVAARGARERRAAAARYRQAKAALVIRLARIVSSNL